jgi:hypothetical protein
LQIAGTRIPIWLIIVYAVALAAVLAWPITAFTSIFAFDDPYTSNNPGTYTAVAVAVCWPVVPLAGVLASFLTYRGKRTVLAYVLAGIAALPAATFALILIASPIMSMLTLIGFKF